MENKAEEINDGLKLIVKSSMFVLLGFILSKFFGYLYRIIIARYYGPEVYGLFSLAVVILGWFVTVSLLGCSEGIVRFFSILRGKKEKNKIRYMFRILSIIIFFSSLFFALLLFFLSDYISISIFHNESLGIYLKIFSIIVPFWAFATIFLAIMRSFERVREVSIIESIIQSFLKLSILIILIFFGMKTNAIIFSFIFGILIIFFLTYSYCLKKIPELFENYVLDESSKKKIFGDFFSYSLPIFLFGFVSIFFYSIDSFAIGYFKGVREVGLYNAILPIIMLMDITPQIFLQLFFPLIAKKYSLGDIGFIKEISKQIGKWIFMLNIPFCVLMLLFPEIIINMLFGSEYILASTSLRFLAISGLYSSIFLVSNNILSMSGKSRIILYDLLVVSLFDVILNLILVPAPNILGIENSLGINGAAISTSASIIFFNSLFLIQARYYTSIIPLKKEMIKIFFGAIISGIILFFLIRLVEINYLSFFLLAVNFLIIYLISLFILRAFDNKDAMIFSYLKEKMNFA